jgi:ABC-type polysaccharide transport system permease subunit
MYLFIAPGFLFFIVFYYVPLLGNIIAFQNYSPSFFPSRRRLSRSSLSSTP